MEAKLLNRRVVLVAVLEGPPVGGIHLLLLGCMMVITAVASVHVPWP